MSADALVERVANDLAEGRSIDWDAVVACARTDEEREQVESLRLVYGIILEHRSADRSQSDHRNDSPAPDVVQPAQGQQWGRFRLRELVGSGSFGSVFRAFDPDLDREIAIKILHKHVSDSLLKERLLKEGRALAKVRHPNVVSVFGVESYGDSVGLCMEFVRGETLDTEIRTRGTFSRWQTAEVGKAVCQALSAVHRAGFVHRDVKARNIMRERDTGRIVLMDFGTGREVDQELTSGGAGIAGTAIYMAPEVLAGRSASPTSDVYSVGVLLYYLLTAAYPVEGGSLEELRSAHMVGLRTPLGDRRPDLETHFIHVVERTLAANPQQRYATPGALLEALDKASAPPRPAWVRYLSIAATTLCAAAVILTALGFVNTIYLNTVLGLSGFTNELVGPYGSGLLDWIWWGGRSVAAPVFITLLTIVGLALTLECKRLLMTTSSVARDVEKAVVTLVHRLNLDNVSLLSSATLLMTTSLLMATWWHFSDLLGALVIYPDVSTVSSEQLALLSPEYFDYHDLYRKAFLFVTIACLVLWYPVVSLAFRKRQPLNHSVIAGGAAVLLLSLLLLDFPYRLLSHAIDFEQVTWQGQHCYLLGHRRDDRLLFCPYLSTPRNRIVPSADLTASSRGTQKESLFTFLISSRPKSAPK